MDQRPGFLIPAFIALLLIAERALADTPMLSVSTDTEISLPGRVAGRHSDDETLVSRYTAISLQPRAADIDPMRIVAQVNFPRMNIKTVGEAIRYLLVRTGYDLVEESQLDPLVVALFAKRLPDSQRTLGPYHVDTMLKILIGPAFRLSTDHGSRRISFHPASPIDATVTAVGTAGQRSKTDASVTSEETVD